MFYKQTLCMSTPKQITSRIMVYLCQKRCHKRVSSDWSVHYEPAESIELNTRKGDRVHYTLSRHHFYNSLYCPVTSEIQLVLLSVFIDTKTKNAYQRQTSGTVHGLSVVLGK